MRTFCAAVLLLLSVRLPGAETAQEPKPKERRTAYLRRVFEKDRAGFGDACRAVLSLVKDEHSDDDFAGVRRELESRGIADPAWDLREESPVDRGTVAYLLCKALGIKGGLTAGVFGMTRRYALRECVYLGLIPGGTTDQYLSGHELLDILGNVEIYRETGGTESLRK